MTRDKVLKLASLVLAVSVLYYLMFEYGGVEVVGTSNQEKLYVSKLDEQCQSLEYGYSLNKVQRVLAERNKELVFSDADGVTSIFWISESEEDEFQPNGYYCSVLFDKDDRLINSQSMTTDLL